MSSFLSTTVFSILVATSWFFIFLTAFPIFVQFVLVEDFNLRLWDVVLGGLPYLVASAAFFVCWLQRRYMLSYRVERIPRRSIAFKYGDAPDPVVDLIQTEYQRVSAISHYSRPKTGSQLGWGLPGTKYEGVYFKRAFSNAVERLDATARKLLPSLPPLSPTTRLSNHFHPLSIVVPVNSTALRDTDSLMQIATLAVDNEEPLPFEASAGPSNGTYGRYGQNSTPKTERSDGEINELEFERGMAAVQELQTIFEKEIEYLGSDLSTVSDSRSQRSYYSVAPSNSLRDYPRGTRRMGSDDAEQSIFRRGDRFYRRDGQGFQLDVHGPEDDDTGPFYDGNYGQGRDNVNTNWRSTRRSGSPSARSFIHAPLLDSQ